MNAMATIPAPTKRPLTIATIIDIVADEFGLTAFHLTSDFRRADMVRARHVAMLLARELVGTSFPAIGHAFGRRDHTTVMRGCERIEARMAKDPDLAAQVGRISARIVAECDEPSELDRIIALVVDTFATKAAAIARKDPERFLAWAAQLINDPAGAP